LRLARSRSAAPEAERVFNIAALAAFASIVVHGLTDHPGSHWIALKAQTEVTHPDRPG